MLFIGKSHNTITFFIYRYADQVFSNDVSAALITPFLHGLLLSGQLQLSCSTEIRPVFARMQNVRDFLPARNYVSRQYLLVARLRRETVFISRLDFFLGRKRISIRKMLSMRKSLHKEIEAVFAR